MADIVDALKASKNNPMAAHPECVVVMPELLQTAIDEIDRLRGLLRQCVYGPDHVDLGDGTTICLHLANKGASHRDIKDGLAHD